MFDYMKWNGIQNQRDLANKLDIREICYPWNILYRLVLISWFQGPFNQHQWVFLPLSKSVQERTWEALPCEISISFMWSIFPECFPDGLWDLDLCHRPFGFFLNIFVDWLWDLDLYYRPFFLNIFLDGQRSAKWDIPDLQCVRRWQYEHSGVCALLEHVDQKGES